LHFVENEEHIVFVAEGAQAFKEARRRNADAAFTPALPNGSFENVTSTSVGYARTIADATLRLRTTIARVTPSTVSDESSSDGADATSPRPFSATAGPRPAISSACATTARNLSRQRGTGQSAYLSAISRPFSGSRRENAKYARK
jgi:hypothetical protein